MRVGFVVPGGLERISGGFLYDRHLIAALRARGVAVDVVPLCWLPPAAGLVANVVPLPPELRTCDVVIEDELAHPSLVLRNRGLRRGGVPVVALVHNLGCRQPSTRWRGARALVERQYLRGVDSVAAVCGSTLRDVEELLGYAPPSVVVPAGRDHAPVVDGPWVQQRASEDGPLRVLFVGALTPAKGLHRLLDVMVALDRAGVAATLDVAGATDGAANYVQGIREKIAYTGTSDRVHLHGLLRGPALWGLYRRAHVLALPSDREAYPLVAIEALAAGLPVLVTNQGGAAELVGEGPHARCLPPDDTAAWTEALAAFARERQVLAAAAQSALARFGALGTWADAAGQIEALCRKTITSNGRRPGKAAAPTSREPAS